MSRLIKVIGLLFLPVAALVFIFALLSGKAAKGGKGLFVQEFDEQNIYG
jgi:hypothetical protein